MVILGIDTCSFSYSVAILKSSDLICDIRSNEENMQCEELVSKIEEILKISSLSYSDIALIAVTSGPGTFNGVRIGMSAAHGISIASGTKIATVSTLQVMSYRKQSTSVCFTPDSQVGFLQTFNNTYNPTSEITEVIIDNLGKDVLVFDVNGYGDSQVSNAFVAGLIAIPRTEKTNLFYGKAPSIHVKTSS